MAIPKVLSQFNLPMETDYFHNSEELVMAVTNGNHYALIFLDIDMQSSGIQTARFIRNLLPDVQIAFLTVSSKFALDAFELNALHYLIKPIGTKELKECIKRFCERNRIPLQILEIKSKCKTYSFPLTCVQKIVSNNKGIDVFLAGNTPHQHIPISFIKAEEQLDPNLFLKLSRGFIVQMPYILCINKDRCRLKDGTEILLSRQSRSEIRKRYNHYLLRN